MDRAIFYFCHTDTDNLFPRIPIKTRFPCRSLKKIKKKKHQNCQLGIDWVNFLKDFSREYQLFDIKNWKKFTPCMIIFQCKENKKCCYIPLMSKPAGRSTWYFKSMTFVFDGSTSSFHSISWLFRFNVALPLVISCESDEELLFGILMSGSCNVT